VNYARRQQYQRIWRAGEAAFVATVLAVLGLGAASIGSGLLAAVLLVGAVGLGVYARHWFSLADRSRASALAPRTPSNARSRRCRQRAGGCSTRFDGPVGVTSTRWRSRPAGSPSRSRPNAPRGALLYPRLSREELEGRFLGLMAYPDLKGERDSSMPLKRWSAEASGLGCRGTRVIWRKLDCLNPNLQTMQRSVCRKDACDRHHALRRFFSLAVATFGVWSVAQ
jgi:hypothetical protein